MMYYIESSSTDPYFNLALEQYVFDSLPRQRSYFMLWQNANSIIIGKYQNTIAEINTSFVKEHGITVARRLSGGGAVYHDLGNLNFTFITDKHEGEPLDFSVFCQPVASAVESLGAKVTISGRNDMTIDGRKFSGNSQYSKQGRVMHHGTLMFDSDLEMVSKALNVSKDKIESKGVKSVRSRVTNIKPYLNKDISVEEFWKALRDFMFANNEMSPYQLTESDFLAVKKLRDTHYSCWDWNYGTSPSYSIQKKRRIEGCGTIEVYLDIAENGMIRDVAFCGDFFNTKEPEELGKILKGYAISEDSLKSALRNTDISLYFNRLDEDAFIKLMLE